MRILYVVHQFFPMHYTGTERFTLDLCKQMQKMGYRVDVLTYGIADDSGYDYSKNKFLIKEYEFDGVSVTSIRHKHMPEDVSFDIFMAEMEEFLYELLPNYDLIHVFHPMRLGTVIKVAKKLNIPIILTLTDFWVICPRVQLLTPSGKLCYGTSEPQKCVNDCYGKSWADKLTRRFREMNELVRMVDCIVAPTYFLASMIKNVLDVLISVIPYGLDYRFVKDIPKKSRDNLTLGFIGSVLPHKGVYTLIKAIKVLDYNNLRVKIYGDYFHAVEYIHQLKNLADNDKRIEFSGKYDYSEISGIFSELDMVVVPSIWWENAPFTIQTSFAYKTPVIASNLGGMSEIVKDGVNGFLFEAGNAENLAEVIRKITTNPGILNRDNIISPPRIEEVAFEYEKIYYELKLLGRSEVGQYETTDSKETIPFPGHVTISNTYKCNLKCIMCFKRFENSSIPYMQLPSMSDELIDKIIHELFPRIETFALTVGGEPLADKNYKKFSDAAKKFNVKLKLLTNGVFLNDFQTIKDILEVSEIIEVSMDGLGDLYENIRIGSKFDIIDRNLKLLVNIRNKLGLADKVKIGLDVVLMKRNIEQLPDIISYASDIGLDWINTSHLIVLDKSLSDECLVNHRVLYNTIYDRSICAAQVRNIPITIPPKFSVKNENKSEGTKPVSGRMINQPNIVEREKIYCPYIYERSWIMVNGDVVPCCNPCMSAIMGNIKKNSFEEVWNNENYSKLRDSFKTGDISECCKNCYMLYEYTDPDKVRFD